MLNEIKIEREKSENDNNWNEIFEESRRGDIGDNRSQIIRLKLIQSVIKNNPLAMRYIDNSNEELIEGASTLFKNSAIAIASVNFQFRLL